MFRLPILPHGDRVRGPPPRDLAKAINRRRPNLLATYQYQVDIALKPSTEARSRLLRRRCIRTCAGRKLPPTRWASGLNRSNPTEAGGQTNDFPRTEGLLIFASGLDQAQSHVQAAPRKTQKEPWISTRLLSLKRDPTVNQPTNQSIKEDSITPTTRPEETLRYRTNTPRRTHFISSPSARAEKPTEIRAAGTQSSTDRSCH